MRVLRSSIFLTKIILAMTLQSSVTYGVSNHDVVQNIAYHVILQTYKDLASQALKLAQAANELSQNKTQENLEATQLAWKNARSPWESSEAFLFGPVDSLGLDPGIDTWPLNKIDLQGVLNSNRNLSVDFVRSLGVNLQGFHTAEYLLFGEGVHSNHKDISELSAREIEYLMAVTSLLAEATSQILVAWETNANPENPDLPGFVEIIANPSPANPIYPSDQAVLVELVKGMLAILDEVANGKMSDPMGASIDTANPELEESPFSWNSLSDFANNVRSALNIFTGDYAGRPGPGIKDVIERTNPNLAKSLEIEIRSGVRKIAQIGGVENFSFRQAIYSAEGRARIQSAIDHLNSVRLRIENEVLPLVEK